MALGLLGALIQHLAALRHGRHEARALQHAQVFRDRGPRHRQAAREIGGAHRPATDALDQLAAGRVGERQQRAVERLSLRAACDHEPSCNLMVTQCQLRQSDRRKGLWTGSEREGGLEAGEVRFGELQRAGRRVLGDVRRRARPSGSRRAAHGARGRRARSGAESRRARRQSARARGRPRCADPGSCRCRTGCSRRRRCRARRTTARPRARWRAPAGGTAPGCRPAAPRARSPRPSRSSTSKFLTPQERILPARSSASKARMVSSSGMAAAPVQQVHVQVVGLQAPQRLLAGRERSPSRGVLAAGPWRPGTPPGVAPRRPRRRSPRCPCTSRRCRRGPCRARARGAARRPRAARSPRICQVPWPITGTSRASLPNLRRSMRSWYPRTGT